jgi:O-antigen ligase
VIIQRTSDSDLVSSRRLAVFVVVGVLLVAAGTSDGSWVNIVVLLGLVLVVVNGSLLLRRRTSQR